MTLLNPYLGFNGKCREAMTFYQECLGGELTLQIIEGTPVADQMPPEAGQNILHSTLTHGSLVLMGTDCSREEPIEGNTVGLSLNCGTQEEISRLFTALSAGGTVTCPLGEMFWGATFGTLTDKFGKHWILNCDKN